MPDPTLRGLADELSRHHRAQGAAFARFVQLARFDDDPAEDARRRQLVLDGIEQDARAFERAVGIVVGLMATIAAGLQTTGLVTTADLGRRWGMRRETVRLAFREVGLPVVFVANAWRVREAHVDEFLRRVPTDAAGRPEVTLEPRRPRRSGAAGGGSYAP